MVPRRGLWCQMESRCKGRGESCYATLVFIFTVSELWPHLCGHDEWPVLATGRAKDSCTRFNDHCSVVRDVESSRQVCTATVPTPWKHERTTLACSYGQRDG